MGAGYLEVAHGVHPVVKFPAETVQAREGGAVCKGTNMFKPSSRALPLGIVCAALAFSIALATSDTHQTVRGESSSSGFTRAIGTQPLTFNNPVLLTGGRDLGDVALNVAAVTTRYLRATGGLTPYNYTISVDSPLEFKDLITGGFSNGYLNGHMPYRAAGKTSFNGIVTDSSVALRSGAPLTHSETFSLNVVSDSSFRFSVDQLNTAQTYRGYVDKLDVINPKPGCTYSVSGITFNGNVANALEDVGLSLCPADGTIFGRPYQAGVLKFTASYADSTGTTAALSRSGQTGGQAFTLTILSNQLITSEVAVTQIKVQQTAKTNSLTWRGLVNLNGNSAAHQPVELRVGSYTSPSHYAFDDTGAVIGPVLTYVVPDGLNMTGSLNAAGLLSINIQDSTTGAFALGDTNGLIPYLNGKKAADTRLVAVFLRIGQVVMDANFYSFNGRQAGKASSYVSGDTYGGDFMLTKVIGKDISGIGGTQWKGTYLLRPFYSYIKARNVFQLTAFDNSKTLVDIGADFVGRSGEVVWQKGIFLTGAVVTQGPTGQESGISMAHAVTDGTTTSFGVHARHFDSTGKFLFSVESSRSIISKANTWVGQ